MKKCTKCLEVKELLFFNKDKSRADGHASRCKTCRGLHPSRTVDPYKIAVQKEKNNKKRREDPLVIKKNREYKKDYYSKNKEIINLRERNRINNNLNVKIANQLRKRTGEALKNKARTGSAVRDLGCTIEHFIQYLESKFQEGMSWDNYGLHGWHIDHIKSLSSFNLENRDEFKVAAHYTNLQPLWAEDNLRKWKY